MWLVGGTQDSSTCGLRGPIHRLLREVAKHPVLLPHSHTVQVPAEQSSLFGHLKQWVPVGGGELPDSVECRSQPSSLGVTCCFLSQLRHMCVSTASLTGACAAEKCRVTFPVSLPVMSRLSLLIAEGENLC